MKRTLLVLQLALLPGVAAAENDAQPLPASDSREYICMGGGPYDLPARITACKTYAEDHGTDPTSWTFLAMAYEEAGDLPNAIRTMDDAIRMKEWPNRFRLRAIYQAEAGNEAAALADAAKLAKMTKEGPVSLSTRCLVRAIIGKDLQAALDDCEDAAEAYRSPNTDALMNRAIIFYKQERWKLASDTCEHVLKLEPGVGMAAYLHGMVAARLGNAAAAETDFKASRETDPGAGARLARYGVKP